MSLQMLRVLSWKVKFCHFFQKKVFSSTSTAYFAHSILTFACRTDHLSDAIDVHRILNLFTSYGQNRWRLVICQDRARVCLPDAPCQRALLQPFTTAFGCHTRCVSRTNPKKSGRLPATRFTLTPTTRVVIWDISTYEYWPPVYKWRTIAIFWLNWLHPRGQELG